MQHDQLCTHLLCNYYSIFYLCTCQHLGHSWMIDIHSFMLVARFTSSPDDSQHHGAHVAICRILTQGGGGMGAGLMGAACDVIDTSRWPLASHRPVWWTQCIQRRAAATAVSRDICLCSASLMTSALLHDVTSHDSGPVA